MSRKVSFLLEVAIHNKVCLIFITYSWVFLMDSSFYLHSVYMEGDMELDTDYICKYFKTLCQAYFVDL